MLVPILSAWLAVAAPAAHAAADPGVLCLSDGQTLQVESVRERAAHRTVRLDGVLVDVPASALGTTCQRAPRLGDTHVPRKIVLVDGQSLYGTPLLEPGAYAVTLLDGRRFELPEDLVAKVEPVALPKATPREAPSSSRQVEVAAIGAAVSLPTSTNPFLGGFLVLIALGGGIAFGLSKSGLVRTGA